MARSCTPQIRKGVQRHIFRKRSPSLGKNPLLEPTDTTSAPGEANPENTVMNQAGYTAEGAAVSGAAPTQTATASQTVTYSMSAGFVPLLQRLNVSVALTSYQSGRLYLLGRNPSGGLMVDE